MYDATHLASVAGKALQRSNPAALFSDTEMTRRNFLVVLGAAGSQGVSTPAPLQFGALITTAPTIDIKEYGAVGDGNADDSGPIQAAFDAAAGSSVICSAGTYHADGLILRENTTLVSRGATFLGRPGNSNSVLTLTSGCRIYGLSVDGNRDSKAPSKGDGAGNNGIECAEDLHNNHKNIGIYGCTVTNCAKNGVLSSRNSLVEVESCVVRGCKRYGILFFFGTHNVVSGNHVEGCYHGIGFWGADGGFVTSNTRNMLIVGNTCVGGRGAIWGANGSNIIITLNTVADATDIGIDVEGCEQVLIACNTVRNGFNAGIGVFNPKGKPCTGVIITGNRISFNEDAYVSEQATAAIRSFGGGHAHIVVCRNTVMSAKAGVNGIRFESGGAGNLIYDNTFTTSSSGIVLRLFDRNVVVRDNRINLDGTGAGITLIGIAQSVILSNTISFAGEDRETHPSKRQGIYLFGQPNDASQSGCVIAFNIISGFNFPIVDDSQGEKTPKHVIMSNTANAIYVHAARSANLTFFNRSGAGLLSRIVVL